MKTAPAIFGALAAAVGLAAVVTFYDEFMPGTQMPPHPNEAAEKGDLLTPARSIAHDFAALPKSVHTTSTNSISQDSAAAATVDCHGVGAKTCNPSGRVFERCRNFVLAC
jgi:hypothetical protein